MCKSDCWRIRMRYARLIELLDQLQFDERSRERRL
jgi:hypothetical protein